MNARRLLAAVLVLVASGVSGCGPESPTGEADAVTRWRIHTRLVAPAERRRARSEPPELLVRRPLTRAWEAADPDRPTATLRDDTRPVLAAPRRTLPVYAPGVLVPADRRLPAPARLVKHLPPDFDWVLAPMVRDSAHKKDASLHLEGVLVPRRSGQPSEAGDLRIEIPESMRARRVDFFARAYAAPSGGHTRYESGRLRIPSRARLELAFGVLEPARATGPVEFSVSACRGERCEVLFVERHDPRQSAREGWQERVIDLGDRADAALSLRFEATWDGDAPGAFSLPVFADPRILAPDAAASVLPSVILLSIDTLRADHLPVYGYTRETAPFMRDSLAARGTVFDDFVAAATTTGPSHMAMFTSLPPSVHGVTTGQSALQAPVSTLAMALRDAGYETAAFTDDGPIDHELGFELGFDRFIENKSARAMEEGQVEATFARARRQLESFGERPSFLFLHTFQVHGPYTPPALYDSLFAEEAPASGASALQREAFAKAQRYDREIRYTDDALRALVTWLEARGFFESGLLVVTSDHGEEFQEHGYTGHAGLPHEELLRIPLLLFGKDVAPGRRVGERVTHIDLMPTLLEWAGVDAPSHATGRSFGALVRSGEAAPGETGPPRRSLVSEAWAGGAGRELPALAAREGRHKLLRFVGPDQRVTYRYFDLEDDPREQSDRYAAMSGDATVRGLRELVDGYAAAADLEQARVRSSVAGAPGSRDGEAVPLDPEREAKLRVLGYIE